MSATRSATIANLNRLAKAFRSLHVSGRPVILTNVHDAISAQTVASLPNCHAIASASWAIAATQGIEDDDMTFEENLVGIQNIIKGLSKMGKLETLPLSVDLQNGYDLAISIPAVISLGCVGANIEDVNHSTGQLFSVDDAAARVKLALQAASDAGVPDFVINARTDAFLFDGTIEDVEHRAKAYLDAGATTAFVWGGKKHDLTAEDVTRLSQTLNGRLAVQGPGVIKPSLDELSQAGVARISYGPYLLRQATQHIGNTATVLLRGPH